jgi:hypothetical protein
MSDFSIWKQPADADPKHRADDETTEMNPVAPVDTETEQLALLEDPFADDLSKRLKSAAPLRLANRATYILVALVIGVAGFVAGAQVQKSYGATASPAGGTFPTALPSGLAGGGFGNRGGGTSSGNTGTGGAGGQGITGTVKLVDGTTVYVEQADGTVITVKTSDSTSVLAPSTLKDLKAGATVTVRGQNNDGTVTASSITQTK